VNPKSKMSSGVGRLPPAVWGIHLCVGAPLARVEAKVAFERLLARTASFAVDPARAPLRYHRSLMIRRLVALPLVFDART